MALLLQGQRMTQTVTAQYLFHFKWGKRISHNFR